MNHEKIDRICKRNSERGSNGEVVMGFMVLVVIALLMSCQPAKEGIKPHPVYEKGMQQ